MRHENRMHRRRALGALFSGQRRTRAAGALAHIVPEFVEIMRRGRIGQLFFQRRVKRFIGRVHIGKHRIAQRLAITMRHLMRVQHIHETHRVAIGHIRVPILPGIRQANRLPVFNDIRKYAHFRHIGILEFASQRGLDAAKAQGKIAQSRRFQQLPRKAQHAPFTQSAQNAGEILIRKRLGQINAGNAGAQH